ncbi:hypothetical protein [Burkholderia vietnamiensis]|uniref:hypothetical protein n=1 Tax=Burkholderia vietnamiensis TaxID=60552 RepID=UPI001CF38CAD|nr:hypothetical protein [Burkholderia vietnamiensis]MCA8148129.1 hypothetical protein [Burkholderia vietnamiensis]
MRNTTGGDRPQTLTPRAGIRTARFWATLYAGLMVITLLVCAFGAQGFFARYDDNALVIGLAVLACTLLLNQADRRLREEGRRLHRVNAYITGLSSPMLMGVLASWLVAPQAVHLAAAGWSDNLHLLVANLAVLWTGVTVVRLLQDPHPDLRGGLFRAGR